MRRGFKSWCENTSAEYRTHLGLDAFAPLDPHDLARHLGVLVWTPHDVPALSAEAVRQLTEVDPSSWSAVTIAVAGHHLVILNSRHALTRQHNSLAHELAHLILNHRPANASVSAEGFLFSDRFDANQEEEADWLAGALLLPREGLRRAYQQTSSSTELASYFGVSPKLVEWRLRMTGIIVQARRAAKKRGV